MALAVGPRPSSASHCLVPAKSSPPGSAGGPAGVLSSKGDKAHPKRPWGHPQRPRRPPRGPFPLLSGLPESPAQSGNNSPGTGENTGIAPAGAQPAGAQGGVTWPGGKGLGRTRSGWSPVTPTLRQVPRVAWIRRVPLGRAMLWPRPPSMGGAAMGLLRPLDAAGTGPEDGERRSLSPGKGHQIAASTGEIAEVARATGQGPGGRTSEEPTGAAGKSRDPASGGHVQNNWPTAL